MTILPMTVRRRWRVTDLAACPPRTHDVTRTQLVAWLEERLAGLDLARAGDLEVWWVLLDALDHLDHHRDGWASVTLAHVGIVLAEVVR